MPSGRLIKHQRTQGCGRNTQIQWWRRDGMIVIRCTEASFILTGEDEAEFIEGVDTFKYLVWILNRSDNNWLAVCQNFGKAR